MTKESEQMLEKKRIPTSRRIKERSVKVAVSEKHSNSSSEYGNRKEE